MKKALLAAMLFGFGVSGFALAETPAEEKQREEAHGAVHKAEAQSAHDKEALHIAIHKLDDDRAHHAPLDVQERDREEINRLTEAEKSDASHLKTDAEMSRHADQAAH